MYKKFLIIASRKDLAGMNIVAALNQFGKYDFYIREEEIISQENLDTLKISQYDFVIFASKHQSAEGGKTLSIHAPGNLKNSSEKNLCPSSALFQKFLFQELNKQSQEHMLKYQVTLECTHHGPIIDKPCVFIEIGSTLNEWRDKRAAFVVAKTIRDTIENFKPNEYREIAIGIGGPHYCPNFNKIQLNSNVALSHIIPSYILPVSEQIVLEAINKTQEEIDFVLLDWKGIGPQESRNQIISILDKNHINYKKIKEIKN